MSSRSASAGCTTSVWVSPTAMVQLGRGWGGVWGGRAEAVRVDQTARLAQAPEEPPELSQEVPGGRYGVCGSPGRARPAGLCRRGPGSGQHDSEDEREKSAIKA